MPLVDNAFLEILADVMVVEVVFAGEEDAVYVTRVGKRVLARASDRPHFNFKESAELDAGHLDDQSGVKRIKEVLNNLDQNSEIPSANLCLCTVDPVQKAWSSVIKLGNNEND